MIRHAYELIVTSYVVDRAILGRWSAPLLLPWDTYLCIHETHSCALVTLFCALSGKGRRSAARTAPRARRPAPGARR